MLTPESIRDALVAAESGEPDALRAVLDRAVTWHTPLNNLTGGDHMGVEQSVELMREYQRLSGGSLRVEPVGFSARAGIGAIRLHATAARAGHGRLDVEAEISFRLENGKVVEMWTKPRDPLAWDRFWAP